jgi:uncharacterized protein YodC (DUF2158 family)
MANSKSKFKAGDLVQLKSGSPPLTVEDPDFHDARGFMGIRCTWFAGKKHEIGYFQPETLIDYTPPETKK